MYLASLDSINANSKEGGGGGVPSLPILVNFMFMLMLPTKCIKLAPCDHNLWGYKKNAARFVGMNDLIIDHIL